MAQKETATKGNLMKVQKSLKLSQQGYSLMDRKRVILINELMSMVEEAKSIQEEITIAFHEAYSLLEEANIALGIDQVSKNAVASKIDDSLKIKVRSIMGSEVVEMSSGETGMQPTYSFHNSSLVLDEAKASFEKVKQLTIRLAEVENSVFRLAANIRKTQKRANALKNISIPRLAENKKMIQSELEEKEREEFIRMKVIKQNVL